MKGAGVGLVAALLGAACVSTRPPADARPIAPVVAREAAATWQELLARRAQFTGAQSFLRVRVSAGGRVQSFRARLSVDYDGGDVNGRMQLDVLTPIGTTAVTIYADGDRLTFINHLQRTWWQGSAAEVAHTIGFFAASTRPADFAMLLLGLPAATAGAATPNGVPCASGICRAVPGALVMAAGSLTYEIVPGGFNRVAAVGSGELVLATFTPPGYPPSKLIVEHYTATGLRERLDLEHLEVMATAEPLTAPEIPEGYQGGVLPRM
jgi:hypothetical protein